MKDLWRIVVTPDIKIHTLEISWRLRLLLWVIGLRTQKIPYAATCGVVEIHTLGTGKEKQ